ncbi:UTP--glucose-1-phosphate uridylyltransferase [Aestuariimicrobium soli]|uniref:UTP--glucose-1-phosphate uridylyltransferase n=1 Tax=Aestuariimicrobium soli TaxID=2035834 RepID=UPI003EC14F1F
MSEQGLAKAQQKMREAGVAEPAIEVFSHYYGQLETGASGLILEETIEPMLEVPMLADIEITDEEAAAALDRTVLIKLNGGLATSMGLDKAKTLLEVRDGKTFLDLIVGQVMAARQAHDARLPLILMNSFRTRDDALAALAAHPDLPVEGLPLDFLQNQEPKLDAATLEPISWPDDPSLEWCPPGHGDLYTALEASGLLDQLLDAGFQYASVSNGDNLGAAPDPRIAGWFAASGAPYAAEVCRRTVNDRKGGHLAIRKRDGQLILRDTAQTAPDEMDYFTDEHRHPFFHTNNLWFDLQALRDTLAERDSVLGLPLIKNEKTVDPADKTSPKVIQVESAMGAAIEVFEGATAICVDRSRFLPVKTTNELLLVRSDCYRTDELGRLTAVVDDTPLVDLDGDHYKVMRDFDARIPVAPSLARATALRVKGDVTFEPDVTVVGDVTITADQPRTIARGTTVDESWQ